MCVVLPPTQVFWMIPGEKSPQSRTWKQILVTEGFGVWFLDPDYLSGHQMGYLAVLEICNCSANWYDRKRRISRAAPKAVIGDSVALDPSAVHIYISFTQAVQTACHCVRWTLRISGVRDESARSTRHDTFHLPRRQASYKPLQNRKATSSCVAIW